MNTSHLINLDFIRGFAALLVVFDHGITRGLWPGYLTGQVGVAVFFCLSGFLMGYLYSSKIFDFHSVSRYVISRFARIAPAYLTIVIFSYFIFTYLDNQFVYKISEQNVLRHLLFSGNFHVFWTIPPEVQFYIFFILIWFSIQSLFKSKNLPIIIISITSVLLIYFGEHFPGTTLPFTLHFFLFGCLAGIFRDRVVIEPVKYFQYFQIAFFIGTILLGMYLLRDGKSAIFDFFSNVSFAFVCAIMVFILSLSDITIKNFYLKGLFLAIGKCSFSLYLIHEIVLYLYENLHFSITSLVNLFICFSLSIAISYCFYHFYEMPFNKVIKNKLNQLISTG